GPAKAARGSRAHHDSSRRGERPGVDRRSPLARDPALRRAGLELFAMLRGAAGGTGFLRFRHIPCIACCPMQVLLSSYIRGLSRPAEIVIVVMIFAGWFSYASIQAVLAGFPPPQFEDTGLVLLLVFEMAAFAIGWTFWRVRGWRLAHFNIDPSWGGLLVGALLFGFSLVIDAALWELFAKHSAARAIIEDIARTKTATPIVVLLV